VVGARDALGSVQRQYSQLDRVRSQHVDDVAQNNARIRSLRGRMASMAEDIAAAQASPSVAQGSLSSVEALLAQMTPTVQSAAPAGSPDDDATAMFDPRALRARMVKEQEEEDAADQTVIFSRKPAVLEDSAAEDSAAEDSAAEDSAATAIFSVAELRKRVLAEESKEDEPDEAATAIFLRPQKTEEDR
jgi:small-conductance mechanosensitive channel